jgi:hypothetical protein
VTAINLNRHSFNFYSFRRKRQPKKENLLLSAKLSALVNFRVSNENFQGTIFFSFFFFLFFFFFFLTCILHRTKIDDDKNINRRYCTNIIDIEKNVSFQNKIIENMSDMRRSLYINAIKFRMLGLRLTKMVMF